MGAVSSYFFQSNGRTDDADPVTGLTSRDRYLISTTWDKVAKDPTACGVALFLRLFEINPKHKQAFPFRDQPTKELPTDKKFQAHVNGVIYSVSSIVRSIDDAELMKSIIHKIGQNHAKRSLDRQAMIDVKNTMLDLFTSMSQEELDSWTKFLDYFVEETSKALKEYSSN